MRLAVIALLGAVLSAPATAQSGTGEPSPAAVALARTLASAQPWATVLADTTRNIAEQLLRTVYPARGMPCDPALTACRAAAERLAREEAPAVVEQRRTLRIRLQAVYIDQTMTPVQIADATAFARTEAGKAFAHALAQDSGGLSPERKGAIGRIFVEPAPPRPGPSLIDRFYDATTGLPRGRGPMPPPPIFPRQP